MSPCFSPLFQLNTNIKHRFRCLLAFLHFFNWIQTSNTGSDVSLPFSTFSTEYKHQTQVQMSPCLSPLFQLNTNIKHRFRCLLAFLHFFNWIQTSNTGSDVSLPFSTFSTEYKHQTQVQMSPCLSPLFQLNTNIKHRFRCLLAFLHFFNWIQTSNTGSDVSLPFSTFSTEYKHQTQVQMSPCLSPLFQLNTNIKHRFRCLLAFLHFFNWIQTSNTGSDVSLPFSTFSTEYKHQTQVQMSPCLSPLFQLNTNIKHRFRCLLAFLHFFNWIQTSNTGSDVSLPFSTFSTEYKHQTQVQMSPCLSLFHFFNWTTNIKHRFRCLLAFLHFLNTNIKHRFRCLLAFLHFFNWIKQDVSLPFSTFSNTGSDVSLPFSTFSTEYKHQTQVQMSPCLSPLFQLNTNIKHRFRCLLAFLHFFNWIQTSNTGSDVSLPFSTFSTEYKHQTQVQMSPCLSPLFQLNTNIKHRFRCLLAFLHFFNWIQTSNTGSDVSLPFSTFSTEYKHQTQVQMSPCLSPLFQLNTNIKHRFRCLLAFLHFFNWIQTSNTGSDVSLPFSTFSTEYKHQTQVQMSPCLSPLFQLNTNIKHRFRCLLAFLHFFNWIQTSNTGSDVSLPFSTFSTEYKHQTQVQMSPCLSPLFQLNTNIKHRFRCLLAFLHFFNWIQTSNTGSDVSLPFSTFSTEYKHQTQVQMSPCLSPLFQLNTNIKHRFRCLLAFLHFFNWIQTSDVSLPFSKHKHQTQVQMSPCFSPLFQLNTNIKHRFRCLLAFLHFFNWIQTSNTGSDVSLPFSTFSTEYKHQTQVQMSPCLSPLFQLNTNIKHRFRCLLAFLHFFNWIQTSNTGSDVSLPFSTFSTEYKHQTQVQMSPCLSPLFQLNTNIKHRFRCLLAFLHFFNWIQTSNTGSDVFSSLLSTFSTEYKHQTQVQMSPCFSPLFQLNTNIKHRFRCLLATEYKHQTQVQMSPCLSTFSTEYKHQTQVQMSPCLSPLFQLNTNIKHRFRCLLAFLHFFNWIQTSNTGSDVSLPFSTFSTEYKHQTQVQMSPCLSPLFQLNTNIKHRFRCLLAFLHFFNWIQTSNTGSDVSLPFSTFSTEYKHQTQVQMSPCLSPLFQLNTNIKHRFRCLLAFLHFFNWIQTSNTGSDVSLPFSTFSTEYKHQTQVQMSPCLSPLFLNTNIKHRFRCLLAFLHFFNWIQTSNTGSDVSLPFSTFSTEYKHQTQVQMSPCLSPLFQLNTNIKHRFRCLLAFLHFLNTNWTQVQTSNTGSDVSLPFSTFSTEFKHRFMSPCLSPTEYKHQTQVQMSPCFSPLFQLNTNIKHRFRCLLAFLHFFNWIQTSNTGSDVSLPFSTFSTEYKHQTQVQMSPCLSPLFQLNTNIKHRFRCLLIGTCVWCLYSVEKSGERQGDIGTCVWCLYSVEKVEKGKETSEPVFDVLYSVEKVEKGKETSEPVFEVCIQLKKWRKARRHLNLCLMFVFSWKSGERQGDIWTCVWCLYSVQKVEKGKETSEPVFDVSIQLKKWRKARRHLNLCLMFIFSWKSGEKKGDITTCVWCLYSVEKVEKGKETSELVFDVCIQLKKWRKARRHLNLCLKFVFSWKSGERQGDIWTCVRCFVFSWESVERQGDIWTCVWCLYSVEKVEKRKETSEPVFEVCIQLKKWRKARRHLNLC